MIGIGGYTAARRAVSGRSGRPPNVGRRPPGRPPPYDAHLEAQGILAAQPKSTKPRIGLGLRLRAWWNGVEPEDLIVAGPRAMKSRVQKKAPRAETSLVAPLAEWENGRIRVMQVIWGADHGMPGGADHVSALMKPFGLEPGKSVMVFGANIGGAVRTIATECQALTTGYEIDGDLAHAGKQLSATAGLDRKAEMQLYVPADFDLPPNSFDGILSAEALYRYRNKYELLAKLQKSLRPKGQLCITDFVLAPGVKPNDPRLKAFSGEELEFWQAEQYERRFRELSLDVQATEDIGDSYRQMILRGWAELAQADPAKLATARAFSSELEAELAYWADRMKALESGALQLLRFHVIKKSETRLMSDW